MSTLPACPAGAVAGRLSPWSLKLMLPSRQLEDNDSSGLNAAGDDDPSSSTANGDRSLAVLSFGRRAGDASEAVVAAAVTGLSAIEGSGLQVVGNAGIGGGGALLDRTGAEGQCCILPLPSPRPRGGSRGVLELDAAAARLSR
mmetsp:Transcript_42697/g.77582  ORF Transcript_42697/g.77582 Transcript_42697/m.77582 type:complete len:143 (-) Transcript_42697:266-694(-)